MKNFLYVLLAVGILLTTGCKESSVLETSLATSTHPAMSAPREIIPQTTPAHSESDDNGDNMPSLQKTPDPGAQAILQIAMKSLAEKIQIGIDQIHLISIESVIWPDSSLGCPQIGGMYTQMETPGYKLILEANGQAYPFHTDNKERVILCALQPGLEHFVPPTP